jgi:hypothetical protein
MFLQKALYISLYLFTASIAIRLNPNPDFDNNDGDGARSLAPRGNCLPISNGQGNCNIN